MNNLCDGYYNWLRTIGRDVELYGNRPLMSRPCVVCGEPTEDQLVPWSNWELAPHYKIENC